MAMPGISCTVLPSLFWAKVVTAGSIKARRRGSLFEGFIALKVVDLEKVMQLHSLNY
jgi:hypothetical protein